MENNIYKNIYKNINGYMIYNPNIKFFENENYKQNIKIIYKRI